MRLPLDGHDPGRGLLRALPRAMRRETYPSCRPNRVPRERWRRPRSRPVSLPRTQDPQTARSIAGGAPAPSPSPRASPEASRVGYRGIKDLLRSLTRTPSRLRVSATASGGRPANVQSAATLSSASARSRFPVAKTAQPEKRCPRIPRNQMTQPLASLSRRVRLPRRSRPLGRRTAGEAAGEPNVRPLDETSTPRYGDSDVYGCEGVGQRRLAAPPQVARRRAEQREVDERRRHQQSHPQPWSPPHVTGGQSGDEEQPEGGFRRDDECDHHRPASHDLAGRRWVPRTTAVTAAMPDARIAAVSPTRIHHAESSGSSASLPRFAGAMTAT